MEGLVNMLKNLTFFVFKIFDLDSNRMQLSYVLTYEHTCVIMYRT